MQIGAGIASLLMMLSGGTGAFAYQADAVTPEHPLYGVRTQIENVQERFKKSPEARAKFHEKMAERRVGEFDRTDRPEHKAQLRERAIELLDLSQEELDQIKEDPEARAAIKERLDALRDTRIAEMRIKMQERIDAALENDEIDEERAAEILERIENGEMPHRPHGRPGEDGERPEHRPHEGERPVIERAEQ